ncbi:MAG: hypothetical protein AAF587_25810 [Bacteroidota bacterium]
MTPQTPVILFLLGKDVADPSFSLIEETQKWVSILEAVGGGAYEVHLSYGLEIQDLPEQIDEYRDRVIFLHIGGEFELPRPAPSDIRIRPPEQHQQTQKKEPKRRLKIKRKGESPPPIQQEEKKPTISINPRGRLPKEFEAFGQLRDCPNLQVVFLQMGYFHQFRAQLPQLNVPAVILPREEMAEEAVRLFARELYQSLSEGSILKGAVDRGNAYLNASGSEDELYASEQDPQLEIKQLITEGKLEEALQQMMGLAREYGAGTQADSVAIQSQKYNQLQHEIRLGLIPPSEANVQTNRIIMRLLSMLNEMSIFVKEDIQLTEEGAYEIVLAAEREEVYQWRLPVADPLYSSYSDSSREEVYALIKNNKLADAIEFLNEYANNAADGNMLSEVAILSNAYQRQTRNLNAGKISLEEFHQEEDQLIHSLLNAAEEISSDPPPSEDRQAFDKEAFLQLVKEDKIAEGFHQLEDYARRNNDDRLRIEVIRLYARYDRSMRNKHVGIISLIEAHQEEDRIVHSLLNLAEEFPSERQPQDDRQAFAKQAFVNVVKEDKMIQALDLLEGYARSSNDDALRIEIIRLHARHYRTMDSRLNGTMSFKVFQPETEKIATTVVQIAEEVSPGIGKQTSSQETPAVLDTTTLIEYLKHDQQREALDLMEDYAVKIKATNLYPELILLYRRYHQLVASLLDEFVSRESALLEQDKILTSSLHWTGELLSIPIVEAFVQEDTASFDTAHVLELLERRGLEEAFELLEEYAKATKANDLFGEIIRLYRRFTQSNRQLEEQKISEDEDGLNKNRILGALRSLVQEIAETETSNTADQAKTSGSSAEIKNLLTQQKVAEAIEHMMSQLNEEENGEWTNRLTLLKNQWGRLQKDRQRLLVLWEDAEVEERRIIQTLLQLLEEFPFDAVSPNSILLNVLWEALAEENDQISETIARESGGEVIREREKRRMILEALPFIFAEPLRILMIPARSKGIEEDLRKPGKARFEYLLDTYRWVMEQFVMLQFARLWKRRREQEGSSEGGFFLRSFFQEQEELVSYNFAPILPVLMGELSNPDGAGEAFDEESDRILQEFSEESPLQLASHRLYELAFNRVDNQSARSALPDDQYLSLCQEAEEHLASILRSLTFLARYRWASVGRIRTHQHYLNDFPTFAHEIIHWKYSTKGPKTEQWILDSFLGSRSVCLLKKNRREDMLLNLSPFLIDGVHWRLQQEPELFIFSHVAPSGDRFFVKNIRQPNEMVEVLRTDAEELYEQLEAFMRDVLHTSMEEIGKGDS